MSSSNVKSIGYDEETRVLEVEFVNGSVYQYIAVPPATYRELMTAPSIGSYLNREIKRHYEAIQLD